MYLYEAYVNRVVDGDTLDLDVDLGFYMIARIRVRLARVNTPETFGVRKGSAEYKAGMKAKKFVTHMLKGQTVMIATEKTGKYGRWIAEVNYGPNYEINLNDELLEKSLAKLYH